VVTSIRQFLSFMRKIKPFDRHGRIYTSNLIVSSAYLKYVYDTYRGVKDMEKFDFKRRHGG
jgi:hypothetical protein